MLLQQQLHYVCDSNAPFPVSLNLCCRVKLTKTVGKKAKGGKKGSIHMVSVTVYISLTVLKVVLHGL